jgi:hypothetical protein
VILGSDVTESYSLEDDRPTLLAIGAAAASLAAFAHEAVGHGIGCLAVGGRIMLLTSIYFRCFGATPLTDAAGPIGNLLPAVGALMLLHMQTERTAPARLFLLMLGGINLFWFAGQMIYSAVLNIEDIAFAARDLSWPWSWRILAFVAGLATYGIGIRQLTPTARAMIVAGQHPTAIRRRIGIAYLGAAASAVAAGLLWMGNPLGSAINGLLTVGIAPFGIWLVAIRAQRLGPSRDDAKPVTRSNFWLIVALAIFLAFAATQGRGIGPLA